MKPINAIKDVLQGHSKPTWTGTIILVMVLMIAVMVAGFLFVSDRQKNLHDGRIENRDMRMARQALMETDVAVLNATIDTVRGDARRYGAALDKLSTHPDAHFPVTVKVDGKVIPGPEMIRSLKGVWADMMARVNAGDYEGARKIYVSRDVQSSMEAVVRAMIHDLERLDTSNDSMQAQAELATAAVMIMQLLSGLFCIVAFLFATRRGAIEAKARAQAVVTANESREQVMRLFQMTDMLQSASDHSDAKAVLRSTALELIPDLTGALYLFNNSRDRLGLAACWNLGDDAPPADIIGLSECWALKRGKAHTNHARGDKLCCDHHKPGFHALEIPMVARGQVLGLLRIQTARADGQKRLAEIAGLGAALADAMSLALANIALSDKLRSQALRDPLTGLYNRRYMEDTLQRVTQLAHREKQDVSLIMIDLDHFKRLNDQHGHAKGDSVLRDSAAAILSHMRESDVACRYGGEELLVVMPNCGIEQAAEKAEQLRASIQGLSETGIPISASFGVASIPVTSSSARDMMQAADAALYEAKKQGRNRVVCAPALKAQIGEKKGGDNKDGGKPSLVSAAE